MSTVTKNQPVGRAQATRARTTAEAADRRKRRNGQIVAIAATVGVIATAAAVALSFAGMRASDLPGVVS